MTEGFTPRDVLAGHLAALVPALPQGVLQAVGGEAPVEL